MNNIKTIGCNIRFLNMISEQDEDNKVVTQMLIVAGEWTGATLSSEVYFILYFSVKPTIFVP